MKPRGFALSKPFTRRYRPPLLMVLAFSLAFVSGCGSEGVPEWSAEGIAIETEAIRDLLAQQVKAWNEGDIDTFMDGYWREDGLRFVSNGTVTYGWQTTLENYKVRYPSLDAMGQLTFEELDIRVLTPEWAITYGRFILERTEEGGGELTGLFTLVIERQTEGWRIVEDHTSTEH